jgi:carbamoyltransferase
LGYTKYDAGKIMGLGGYGRSDVTYRKFRKFIEWGSGTFRIDNHILRIREDEVRCLEETLGMARRKPGDPIREEHADLVAGLQKITEELILHLTDHLARMVQTDNLCIAGGVALNCQANARLAEAGTFKHLFIPPHCHDAGTSIGAALYLSCRSGQNSQEKERPFSPYWRTASSESEVQTALRESSYAYRKVAEINKTAAKLLAEGEIVAYYHGASEIGPRALGNRSILAGANAFMIKDRLNFHIKEREFYRPLAPMILREHLHDYFEVPMNFSPSLYYMLFALRVKQGKQHLVPGITHIDGTARLQVVDETINPNLYNLLNHYYALTGLPILLNTSFNRQEPIVHTPREALQTFSCVPRLKYLVIEDFLVEKDCAPVMPL